MLKKLTLWLLVAVIAVFIIIQFIPLAGTKTNPPVVAEPQWDSPQTRVLATRACYDCHSNETKWPWYSNVAPVSWLVINHTNEGRQALNFSQWGMGEQEAEEAAETVLNGTMPPRTYLITHPEARLSEQEKDLLVQGLRATFGGAGEEGSSLETQEGYEQSD